MKKTFVLDANVLLHDPGSLERFGSNDVVIPITVIEEIDQFKREMTERGRNAREVSRHLDHLRQRGKLTEGVSTAGGGKVIIHMGVPIPNDFPFLDRTSADMRILALAESIARSHEHTTFVTKDTNLRLKADAVGITAEDYLEKVGTIDLSALGHVEADVPKEQIDRLFSDRALNLDEMEIDDPGINRPVLLRASTDPQHTALARRDPEQPLLKPIQLPKTISGVSPRNLEQRFALDLLLDQRVPLVNLVGKAGTGKTLLALAAGLMLTLDQKQFRRLLVARPIFPMGRDVGYLPGDLDEKLRPWMQPIFDNLEFLLGNGDDSPRNGLREHPVEYLIESGMLEIEALTYIRGRSLPRQFMIVDEAQNLTPLEVKTVITRAGENTKIVLTGDPDQIDNPYVDVASNGLSYTAQKLSGEQLTGTVLLTRGERSPLAGLAADLL